jgi:hypothetical protein
MPTRGTLFANSYSAQKRNADRWAEIQKNVAQEQDQQAALQSLITAERSTLANLEGLYKASTPSPDLATELLRTAFEGDIAAARLSAAARTAAKPSLPKEYTDLRNAMVKSDRKVTDDERILLAEKMGALVNNPKLSQDQVDLMIADADGLGVATGGVRREASGVSNRPAKTAAPGLSKEEKAKQKGVQASLEAVAMQSPLGYVGGFDGEAKALDLAATQADEGLTFSTKKEALDRYVQMLEDGIASADELARVTGVTDPTLAAKDFEFAKSVYGEAKSTGAFQNKDRKFFEPAWLDQAKRVTELQSELQAAKQAYGGRTPAQEAAARALRERGLDPDDPYVQYTGTRTYDYLKRADTIFESVGQKVEPATPAQQRIVALLDQYDSMKQPWKVTDLERQLGKTLKGAELTDAIGFALAYDRAGKATTKEPTQAERQAQAKQVEAGNLALSKALIDKTQSELSRAQERKDIAERMIRQQEPTAPVTALRKAQEAQKEPSRRYQQLRAGGLSAEAARAQVLTEMGELTLPRESAEKVFGAPAGRAPGQLTAEGVPVRSNLAAIREPTVAEVEKERKQIVLEEFRFEAPPPAPPPAPKAAPKAPPPAPKAAPQPAQAPKVAPVKFAQPAPGAPPARAPGAPPARAPGVTEADQIRAMLRSGVYQKGTTQYNALLDRLDELEGVY